MHILDLMPFDLQRAFQMALLHDRVRRGNAEVRQVVKANSARAAALAGGGSREVARRARQIAAGQLKVSK